MKGIIEEILSAIIEQATKSIEDFLAIISNVMAIISGISVLIEILQIISTQEPIAGLTSWLTSVIITNFIVSLITGLIAEGIGTNYPTIGRLLIKVINAFT